MPKVTLKMIYVLSSAQQIFSVTVRVQESRQGDGAAAANLALNMKQHLSSEVFDEQQRYLSNAAIAAYVSFNKIDQRNRFKASVSLSPQLGEGNYSFIEGSSSSGLGYALSLFDAWWREDLVKPSLADSTIFCTGEIGRNGEIKPISYYNEKIKATVQLASRQAITQFYLCLPKANEVDINEAIKQEAKDAGAIFLFHHRMQALLADLYGQAYDGDPLGRWEAFKGLQSFNYEDSLRFFGRDKDVQRLFNDLQSNDGILIVSGQSGSGKSSLIKAGLIPYLEKQVEQLRWVTTTPKEISGSVLDHLLSHLVRDTALSASDVKKSLLDGSISRDAIESLLTPNESFLFHIDQFEEFYTTDNGQNKDINLSILQELTQKTKRIKVVLSIRNEYLPILLDSGAIKSPVISNVSGNLDFEAWQAIVLEQAAFSGYTFEQTDRSLAHEIIDDALNTPNSLPMVEFVLQQLSEQAKQTDWTNLLTHQAYNDMGRLVGAIAKRADEAVDIAHTDQKYVHHFFSLFVGKTNDGLAYAKRFAYLNNGEQLSPELNAIIKRAIDASILISATTEGNELQLAHDCLFIQWQAVTDWLLVQEAYLQWRNEIDHRFKVWKINKSNSSLINDKIFLKTGIKYLTQDYIPEVELKEFIVLSKNRRSNRVKGLITVTVITISVAIWASNNYLFGLYNSQNLWTIDDVVNPSIIGTTKKYAEFKIGSYAVSENIDKLGFQRNNYIVGRCLVTLGFKEEKVVSVRMFASEECDIDVSKHFYVNAIEKKMLTDTTFEDWGRHGDLSFTSPILPSCNACGESGIDVFGRIDPLGVNGMLETQVGASVYGNSMAQQGFDKWLKLIRDAKIDSDELPVSKFGCPLHKFDAQAFELMKTAKIRSLAYGKPDTLQPQCNAYTDHQYRSVGDERFVDLPVHKFTNKENNSDIFNTIPSDNYGELTKKIVTELWDEKSRSEFMSDPKLIKALYIDIKSGVFFIVSAYAEMEKKLDGAKDSNLNYYKIAATEYYQDIENLSRDKKQLEHRIELLLVNLESDKLRIKELKEDSSEYSYLYDNIVFNEINLIKLRSALSYTK
ncbi:MAG: hypothetical protein M1579_03650 [Gammaproteobacteria bacterium]|nr:hypothetical protein [Gammaproteobacteria bacterium]